MTTLKYNDKVHGYWLDGVRCKGVSTVAKIPDDTWSLDQWRKRMVLLGAAEEPSLLTAARYNEDDKEVLNELAELAMRYAGAHLAAERGTAVHDTVEKVNRGQDVTDELTAARWRMLLDATGFDVEDELVERAVAYPEQKVCGRFDVIARRRADGKLAVIDLKTGASAVNYPHGTVAQLAMYAHAPLLAGPFVQTGETSFIAESFTPMPEDLDLKVGYVLYMPDDGEVQAYAANLVRGYEVVQNVIFPTLDWRRTKPEKLLRRL